MASPSTPPLPDVSLTAQSELAQILRYRQDRRLHIQEQGWIVRRDERTRLREVLRMPPLRPSQLKLRAAQEWFKSQGLMARIIVVKSRKTGISTYVQLDQVLDGLEFGYETLTVSNRAPEADYLFSIGREFYDHYELEKPTLLSDTRRCLVFDNKAEFAVIPGGTEHGGSGRTPQRLHWSEPPKTPKKETLWASLINAVEESPDSQIILEGTAVGRDAVFFELYDETSRTSTVSWTYEGNEPKIHVEIPDQDAWNGWLAIFISPADNPEDRKPFSSPAHREVFESTLSGYEKRFIESSGLQWNEALECVNWVRYILKAKCRGSERLRKQEFPLFAEEAFGSIKFNRFDQDALLEVFHEAPSKRGYLDRRSVWDPSPSLVADNAHDLVIFKPPVKGHVYALGIDPIKGHSYEEMIKNPDQTYEEAAAVVVDCSDFFRQVAVFGGPEYEEETLFTYCKALADWYGAYVQIERGGGYGTHLKEKFEQSDYPKRLLYISDVDHMIGYYMTTASEPALIKSAANMLNRREFILHDRKTYAQYMEAVKTVHGGAAHLPGKTNDYLKAHCHALWCGVWAMSKERPGDGARSGPRRKSAWQKACDKSRGQFDFFH